MEGAWFVRAGAGGSEFARFRSTGVVALGWKEAGQVAAADSNEAIEGRFTEAYPDWKIGSIRSGASQVRRFLRDPKPGDRVVTYDPEARLYLLGQIASDVFYDPTAELPRARKVSWEKVVPRDALSATTRNTLGAIQTIFRVDEDATAELWGAALAAPLDAAPPIAPPKSEAVLDADPTEADARDAMLARAQAAVEDRIFNLTHDEVPHLVAGILRAMGFRARVSPPGPDRGFDVFASPDGLGLQEPRIFVEVKHRNAAMGAPAIRAFLGGRRPGDRCLYVSTGGFTKEARYEAERASVPVELVDLQRLRESLVDHYEKLDAEARTLVPLTRLYWPAS